VLESAQRRGREDDTKEVPSTSTPAPAPTPVPPVEPLPFGVFGVIKQNITHVLGGKSTSRGTANELREAIRRGVAS
jgi:hypothetical protein